MSAVDLPETSTFHATVQGVGPGDLASPGVGGPPNRAPQMLADRTRWLYDQLRPEQTIVLKQSLAMSVPANAWTNIVYDVQQTNDTGEVLTLPVDYVRIPAGVEEVQLAGGILLNQPTATLRVGVAVQALVNGSFPINGGFDLFNRYGLNFYPGAHCKTGWIPVSANDRVSLAVITNTACVTLSPSTPSYLEILLR